MSGGAAAVLILAGGKKVQGKKRRELSVFVVARKMFYDFRILANKGSLAAVWLAAHFDPKTSQKLTKNQILSTNISECIGM